MKRFTVWVLVCALFPIFSFAQEEKAYQMVETIYLKPKAGATDKFIKAVKAHNEKFHKENTPFNSWMEAIITGPDVGYFVWFMGPCTFTDLDSRPADEAHDSDWEKNVTPLVDDAKNIEYWTNMKDLSYEPEGYEDGDKAELWFIDVARGEWSRFEDIMQKVRDVHAKKGKDPISVWASRFNSENGRDVVVVWNFSKWAQFDADEMFKKDYEEMHGEGSWQMLLDDWEIITVTVRQEIWKTVE